MRSIPPDDSSAESCLGAFAGRLRLERAFTAAQSVHQPHGYTLLELVVVLGLICVVSAIAVMAMPAQIREAKADGEMARLIAELRRAKEMATSQRRDIEVQFVGTDEVRLVRHEVPVTASPTLLSTISFEGGAVFQNFAQVPDINPNNFSDASALDFDESPPFIFRAEGTFTDADPNLDPINGTVYLGIYDDPSSARAVTIFGATGMIRGHRWNGLQWVE